MAIMLIVITATDIATRELLRQWWWGRRVIQSQVDNSGVVVA
jgi:hypothetical protein